METILAAESARRFGLPALLVGCLLLCVPGATAQEAVEPAEDGQTRPPAETVGTAEQPPPPERPEVCLREDALGPVRVQIGVVEAVTWVGAELPLPVRVKGVCNLAGFSFWIQIDSRIAELVRVEQTPFLAGKPRVDTEFVGLVPGAPRQTITGIRPRGSAGVDGVGTLARLILRGRSQGATQIKAVRLKLWDPDGEEIESFSVPVRLTVLPAGDPRKRRP
jgi:hypothetical protein